MKVILQYYIHKATCIIFAPFYFHITESSYLIDFLFSAQELVDTLALYLIVLGFVITVAFYRNAVFSVFGRFSFRNYANICNLTPLLSYTNYSLSYIKTNLIVIFSKIYKKFKNF